MPTVNIETHCPTCKAPILWQQDAKGKMVPVNAEEVVVLGRSGVLTTGRTLHDATCRGVTAESSEAWAWGPRSEGAGF